MKTIINIGTSLGNLQGVEIDKPFDDISYSEDIMPKLIAKFGKRSFNVHGWCPVVPKDEEGANEIEDEYDDNIY
jgi:hypothetical protein